jgi:hypothetical protein
LKKKSELLVILKESYHYKVCDLRRIGYDLVCSVVMRDNECHELHYHCCYIHVHVAGVSMEALVKSATMVVE